MAMNGCCLCIKYLVIIFNFLFWLAGIAVLSLGLWLYFSHAQYMAESQESHIYFTPLYVLIAVGAIMTILGFLGCCGALHESPTLLGLFFVFLLVVFVAEIGVGVYAWQNKDEAKKSLSDGFRMLMQKYDEDKETSNQKFVDIVQHDLNCCGATGPQNWADADMNKISDNSAINSAIGGIMKATGTYKVPRSCCRTDVDASQCEIVRQVKSADILAKSLNNDGCIDKLTNMIELHMNIVAFVALGLGLIQVLGLLFSILLCCAIRGDGRGRHMKV